MRRIEHRQLDASNCIPDVEEASCLSAFFVNSQRVADRSLRTKAVHDVVAADSLSRQQTQVVDSLLMSQRWMPPGYPVRLRSALLSTAQLPPPSVDRYMSPP